ncbi:MAG: hypothetical protein QOH12_912 [Solirubrobacteraceae bacterium]|jgi:hypothetical protein|nr:hypothetical protein [Solirubrobacteraceae bacterium]
MRRRRPSARYTVLDEEQLLGGVDLADHPDPIGGRSGGGRGDEWDEWSPDREDEPRDDGPYEWEAGGGADRSSPACEEEEEGEDAARRAPSASRPSGEGGHRRWLAVGFVGALVVVLLVAREIGASLDTVGSRAGRLPTAGTTTGRAPGALAAVPGSSAGEAAVSPVVETPRRPASTPATAGAGGRRGRPSGLGDRPSGAGDRPGRPGGRRSGPGRPASGRGGPSGPGGRPRLRSHAQPDPTGRSRAQPARAPVQGPSRPIGAARGPANPGRGAGHPQASTPGPAPARAVSRQRRGGGQRTPAVAPGRSPAGEFGFER